MGTIAIKAIAKGPWTTVNRSYGTWYEPFNTQKEIDRALWFALSEDITTAITAGDVGLLPVLIDAAERFRELHEAEREGLLMTGKSLTPLFPRKS
ncbi:hypothetical protein KEJ36_03120 [Candidatus Bathyarchaeota archaeon]|nr:hypothetical protein [Candidatus Bathyarchaeota archaeon]MBS7627794.1 hypothetical protein [Candidatus Bathyarchaeota archaeon]